MENLQQRNYKLDNIKAILIFLVVFAHLLEFNLVGINKIIYMIVYSFHMPLFVYISGYFSKNLRKKDINRILLPFIFAELIFLAISLFKFFMFGVTIRIYWITWYLFALFIWKIVRPLFVKMKKYWLLVVFVSIVVSLLIGFLNLGRIVRIITFLPFFLLGMYAKENNFQINLKHKKWLTITLSVLISIFLCFLIIFSNYFQPNWFYITSTYVGTYTIWMRLLLYVVSIMFIAFALLIINNKENNLFNKISSITLEIYLGHGLILYILLDQIIYINPYLHILWSLVVAGLFIALVYYLKQYNHKKINRIK